MLDKRRSRRVTLISLVASLVLVFSTVATATATGGPSTAAGVLPPAGGVCVNHLEHIAPGTAEARITSTACYATTADAFAAMSGGRVAVSADLKPSGVTKAMTDQMAAASSNYLLGWDYSETSYSGYATYWTGTSPCSSSQSWALSYVGSFWNDFIASAQGGWSNCSRFNHYQNSNYGGMRIVCHVSDCQFMGAMDRQTSSLSWDQ